MWGLLNWNTKSFDENFREKGHWRYIHWEKGHWRYIHYNSHLNISDTCWYTQVDSTAVLWLIRDKNIKDPSFLCFSLGAKLKKCVIPSRVSGRGYKIGPVCVCVPVCLSVILVFLVILASYLACNLKLISKYKAQSWPWLLDYLD